MNYIAQYIEKLYSLILDMAPWLILGFLIAGKLHVFFPDDFFATYIQNDFLGMLIILVASIPVYVCATSSVPIAAVLMLKGISPGAALVFLMAGPATNVATISVIGNSMGRKTVFIYLGTLIAGALISGLFIDNFLPREWFTGAISNLHSGHEHGILPFWLQFVSAILFVAFLMNIFIKRLIKKIKKKSNNDLILSQIKNMNEIKVFVRGMNCNHCKMSVEKNLNQLEGIDKTEADLNSETVTISGSRVDLKKVKEAVEEIGYKYDGEVA